MSLKIYNDSINIDDDGRLSFKKAFTQKFQIRANAFKSFDLDPALLVEHGLSSAMRFEKNKDQSITATVAKPTNLCHDMTVSITIAWDCEVNTGAVIWQVKHLWREIGEDATSITPNNTEEKVETVYATANGTNYVDFSLTTPSANDKFVQVKISRIGSSENDTADGSIFLIGLSFLFSCKCLGG